MSNFRVPANGVHALRVSLDATGHLDAAVVLDFGLDVSTDNGTTWRNSITARRLAGPPVTSSVTDGGPFPPGALVRAFVQARAGGLAVALPAAVALGAIESV